MAEHSPGPWRIEEDDVEDLYLVDRDGKTITPLPCSWENARLIVAAPDLELALALWVATALHSGIPVAFDLVTWADGVLDRAGIRGKPEVIERQAQEVARRAVATIQGKASDD